ncbi:MGH1-like glycoside hydrolase domain-containing protein [Paenibacillus mucilaginosus]|uniref:MGH1-like glycoside hydrolase domain-containing protein n=1 Tax=Paenibacillus mucilaginosus TaxID=61624 RepID=UPI003D1BFFA2
MSMGLQLLDRLRQTDTGAKVGALKKESDAAVLGEWKGSGVKFAASSEDFEEVYYTALRKLLDCIVPAGGEAPILHEGGVYLGCWLESTGTINAEILSRFIPSVSEASFGLFADYQREDGLMPYKITGSGPSYRQIQMVTPLARSVWNHYLLNGRNREFLSKMYGAMRRFDGWLAAYRNTRGTGGVEAFCTFDTGHDLSPRFWHVPDTPHLGDPRECWPDSPVLPFVAPDLTANAACQRHYLARIAQELGDMTQAWKARAEESERSLLRHCYHEEDGFFYDLDRSGQHVRVQSDVLLRVLACEIGDRAFFDEALRRYLLNTRKFFAKYPFTSVAMDDPRFDPFSSYNTWAGAVNFLSLIRAPHAFEHHGRHVELTWVLQPILSAMSRMRRFGQCLSPWTGEEGYTESYSPAILCLLDYVERLCGILPTPGGELWFTGLVPYAMDHGREVAEATAYSRIVDGVTYELVNTREEAVLYRDGEEHLRFPAGTRAVTDRSGNLQSLVGMSVRTVQGSVIYRGSEIGVTVKGNEQLQLAGGRLVTLLDIGVVVPAYA